MTAAICPLHSPAFNSKLIINSYLRAFFIAWLDLQHEAMSAQIITEKYQENEELKAKIGSYFEDWNWSWCFIKELITGEPHGAVRINATHLIFGQKFVFTRSLCVRRRRTNIGSGLVDKRRAFSTTSSRTSMLVKTSIAWTTCCVTRKCATLARAASIMRVWSV